MRAVTVLSLVGGLLALWLQAALPATPGPGSPPPAIEQSTILPQASRSGFVNSDSDVLLHYQERGSGPSLLFLTGWTMSADVWHQQLAHFSSDFRSVAYDPRSQGRSSKVAYGLFPEERARDLRAVIQQLQLSPVVLVAWSAGVGEVLAYIEQFGTESLAGLVLVDGSPGITLSAELSQAVLKGMLVFQQERPGYTRRFVESMFRRPQPEALLEKLVEDSLKTPTGAAVAMTVANLATDRRAILPTINVPTLVVAAPGPFRQSIEAMSRQIPGARLETFNEAGHALFLDEPERFNQLLSDFLNRIYPSKPR